MIVLHILLTVLKIILYVILAVIALVLLLSVFPVSAKVLFRKGKLFVDLKYLFIKYRLLPGKEEEEPPVPSAEQEKEEIPEAEIIFAEDIKEDVPSEVSSLEQEEETVTEDLPEEEEETEVSDEEPDVSSGIDETEPVLPEEKEQKPDEEEETESRLVSLWKKIKPFIDPTSKTLVALFHHIHMKDVEIVWNVRSDDAARVGMLSGFVWMVIGEVMRTLALLFGKNLTYKEITVMPCFDPKDGADERFGCEVAVRPIIILLIAIYFLFLYVKGKLFSR